MNFQSFIKIGYLGPVGSFSEKACKELFPQRNLPHMRYCAYETLDALLQATIKQDIDFAVFPIMNAPSDFVCNSDGKSWFSKIIANELSVTAERHQLLDIYLLTLPQADPRKIKYLLTNPYPELQCGVYLENHPEFTIIKKSSSGIAAQTLSEGQSVEYGALASFEAAKKYNLYVHEKISSPTMIFWAISARKFLSKIVSDDFITAMAVITKDIPSLKEIMQKQGKEIMNIYKADMENTYLIEVKGVINEQEISELCAVCELKIVGHYQADPLRSQTHTVQARAKL